MIKTAVRGLAHFLHRGLENSHEPIRLARVGYALITSGCSASAPLLGEMLPSYLVSSQRKDGGWADVEETLWCLGYLAAIGEKYEVQSNRGKKWLVSNQLPCGAWGKSERDQPRIPVTALASVLVPDIVDNSTLKWLAAQWEADLDSSTQLTYKGAFFLLGQVHKHASYDKELVSRTIKHLNGEQEEDGGFGPWKGHPVGSDPWSTGVALWGLSTVGELAPRQTVERALSWLESRQLPNGLWPYHYLDDGTAMALIGISSVLPFFSEQ